MIKYLNFTQRLEPISDAYVRHVNLFCSCSPPTSCTCQRELKGFNEIEPPYDFAKVHGCLPAYCTCEGVASALKAPPADLHLRVFKEVLEEHFRNEIQLVTDRPTILKF